MMQVLAVVKDNANPLRYNSHSNRHAIPFLRVYVFCTEESQRSPVKRNVHRKKDLWKRPETDGSFLAQGLLPLIKVNLLA